MPALLLVSGTIYGQGIDGSISGVVSEKTALPLPAATMQVRNESTGFSTATVTQGIRQVFLPAAAALLHLYNGPDAGKAKRRFPGPLRSGGRDEFSRLQGALLADTDFRSGCLRLSDCLREIKTWSDANPRHFPVVISFIS